MISDQTSSLECLKSCFRGPTMSLMYAKRKIKFVLSDPFLKPNSANSLQSTFARIVLEKPKQTERVHSL